MVDLNDLRTDPPDYCSRVIIASVQKYRFRWYVSDVHLWRLLGEGEFDMEELLLNVRNDRTNTETLRSYVSESAELFPAVDEAEIQSILWDVFPSFFYNFDHRRATVFVDEVLGAYFVVPVDWTWKVQADLDVIPQRERYWILNGTDLFKQHLFDWSQAECSFDSAETAREETPKSDVAGKYKKRIRPWWRFW